MSIFIWKSYDCVEFQFLKKFLHRTFVNPDNFVRKVKIIRYIEITRKYETKEELIFAMHYAEINFSSLHWRNKKFDQKNFFFSKREIYKNVSIFYKSLFSCISSPSNKNFRGLRGWNVLNILKDCLGWTLKGMDEHQKRIQYVKILNDVISGF